MDENNQAQYCHFNISPREDKITDMLVEGDNRLKITTTLMNDYLEQPKTPEARKNAKVVLLHKKRDK